MRALGRRGRAVWLGLFAVCASFAPTPAGAGPSGSFGFGSRGTALGGATSADVRDGSASFYNPSGLALAERTELGAGFAHVSYRLDAGGERARIDSLSVLEASLAARGEIARLPFAFGLALALPNGHLSRMRSLREPDPHWVLYENLPELVDLSAQVALRPLDGLTAGGGVGFLAAARGGFDVTGTVPLSDGKGSEYDAKVRHEVDADLTSVRFPVLGITILPSDRLSFALVYRGEARLEQRITGTLEGNVDAARLFQIPVRYAFETSAVTAFLPRQIVVGSSVVVSPGLRANLDLAWQQWSAYPSPASSSTTALDAKVPAGLPINLPGSSAAAPLAAPDFSNRLVPRIGIEYVANLRPRFGVALRAGYAFERSPAPREQLRTAFIDADRHIGSFGTGLAWQKAAPWLPEVVRIDMHAQLSEWPSSTMIIGSPRNMLNVNGSAWCAGATLTFGFE
jgi:long-chain fatty acid transport protein